jgi:uncharacterized protein (UPF0254 family)
MRPPHPVKVKKKGPDAYSIKNDPMARMLMASGFREMTDAEYEKVRPYLTPKKK